jgi:hypothetical protein
MKGKKELIDIFDSLFLNSGIIAVQKKELDKLIAILQQHKDYIKSHEERLTKLELVVKK